MKIKPFMKQTVVILLFSLSISAFAQNTQLNDLWGKLMIANDNEKNYQFNSFIRFLSEYNFSDNQAIPSGWIKERVSGANYNLYAAILPYANQQIGRAHV